MDWVDTPEILTVALEATIRGLDFIVWATGETKRNEKDHVWLYKCCRLHGNGS